MDKKIKVVISGCCGRMGRILFDEIKKRDDMYAVAGINHTNDCLEGLNVFTYESFDVDHDVLVDFSHEKNLDHILRIAQSFNSRLVICTTGYSKEQMEKIMNFSINHPVFISSNTSLGINLLTKLSKIAKNALGDEFDIEIIEKHHNRKVDAPSGTALSIAKELSDENTLLIFDRSKAHSARSKNEIGISSIRGGNIKGEHEILFISDDEILSIRHSAYSRNIFAKGALDAVRFIFNQRNGLYRTIY